MFMLKILVEDITDLVFTGMVYENWCKHMKIILEKYETYT